MTQPQIVLRHAAIYPRLNKPHGSTKTDLILTPEALKALGGPAPSKTSAASIVPVKLRRGTQRKASNVEEVWGLTLDIDHDPGAQDLGILHDTLSRYHHAVWDTWSSTPQNRKIRVLVPLDEPIRADDYKAARRVFDHLTGGLCDPAARDISRLNILPAWPDASAVIPNVAVNPGSEGYYKPDVSGSRAKILTQLTGGAHKHPERKALVDGQPWGGPGERDNLLTQLVWYITMIAPDEASDREFMEWLFGWSLARMYARDGTADTPGIDDIMAKVERALSKREENPELNPGMSGPLLKVQREYEERGEENPMGENPAVLMQGNNYALWDPQAGKYLAFISGQPQAAMMAYQLWSRHIGADFADDPSKLLSYLRKHMGGGIMGVRSTLLQGEHSYNPETRIFTESLARDRGLEPCRDPKIDEFLDLMAGPGHEDRLRRWVASFPDLSKPLCALQIVGGAATGKTLLGTGLANLWEGSPSSEDALTGNFNEGLAQSPLVYIDESMAGQGKNGKRFVDALRTELTKFKRPLNRKYLPVSTLEGYIRCIITANNNVITAPDDLNHDSIKAISERVFHLDTTPRSEELRKFLVSVGTPTLNRWRESGMAQHALALEQECKPTEPEGRFHVMGELNELAEVLKVGGIYMNVLVLEWIALGLLDPKGPFTAMAQHRGGFVDIRNGELCVHPAALLSGWSMYSSQPSKNPSSQVVSKALETLGTHTVPMEGDARYHLRTVSSKTLELWAEQNGYSAEAVRAALAGGFQ